MELDSEASCVSLCSFVSAQAHLSFFSPLWNQFIHWAGTSCLLATQSIHHQLKLALGKRSHPSVYHSPS